jgi:hypothetical protein
VSAADATERPAWHVLLNVVGAATGIVAFVGFVGGAIVWERLHVLGLPANQGVQPLPRELFLVVGARALAWPLGLGFLAIVVVHALYRLPLSKRAARAAYLALVGLFGAALGLTAQGRIVQQAIFVGFFGLLVGAGAALVGRRRAKLGQISVGLFVSLALVGVVVEAIDIYHLPVHLEYAQASFSDGRKEVSGFLIGETADTVYIAPNGSCYVLGWITALPRNKISRLDIFSARRAWPLSANPGENCEKPP